VLLTVYATHRGPIINRLEPGAQFADGLVSMRWVGHEVSQEAVAFYWMNRASQWSEFVDAVKKFAVPAQNFVYADVDGNIGYYMGGRIPIRSVRGYTLPASGTTTEFDWKGFVPPEANPHDLNPAVGYIATANNKIVDDSYPYHLSNHYEPPWRSMRLHEVLSQPKRFSLEDMIRLQNDVFSPHAREIVPIILSSFDSVTVTDSDVLTALSYLRNWTYEMRAEDVSTTIFQTTFDRLIVNTLHDELGPELSALYDTLASVPLSVVSELLKGGDSAWFDDINTPERESRGQIIRRSLVEAIAQLKQQLGTSVKEWRWGTVHDVHFGHIFGADALLDRLFSVGPFPVGGAHSTVNVSQYFLSRPFRTAVGPSTRQVYDLGDRDNTRAVSPPGQSGQIFSAHYHDQTALWLNGGMRSMPMGRELIDRECSDHLVLKPR
jgi:penicillin amidase